MNQQTQPQVVRSYLRELEEVLVGVPSEIAKEIVGGVSEELSGLDAVTAAAKIEALGNPAVIAAEATANLEVAPLAPPIAPPLGQPTPQGASGIHGAHGVDYGTAQPAAATTDPTWYVVVASLLVAIGGLVIPVLGWVAGIVMLWMAKTWSTKEKFVGTFAAPVLGLLAVLVLYVSALVAPNTSGGMSTLGPVLYDMVWAGFLLVVFVNIIAGLLLLLRGLRRTTAVVR